MDLQKEYRKNYKSERKQQNRQKGKTLQQTLRKIWYLNVHYNYENTFDFIIKIQLKPKLHNTTHPEFLKGKRQKITTVGKNWLKFFYPAGKKVNWYNFGNYDTTD